MVVFLLTYCATDHFKGTTMADDMAPRWWHLRCAETC